MAVIANVVFALTPAKARDAGSAAAAAGRQDGRRHQPDCAGVPGYRHQRHRLPGAGRPRPRWGRRTSTTSTLPSAPCAPTPPTWDPSSTCGQIHSPPRWEPAPTAGPVSRWCGWWARRAAPKRGNRSMLPDRWCGRCRSSAGLRARIAVPETTSRIPLHMNAWQGAAIVAAAAVIAVLLTSASAAVHDCRGDRAADRRAVARGGVAARRGAAGTPRGERVGCSRCFLRPWPQFWRSARSPHPPCWLRGAGPTQALRTTCPATLIPRHPARVGPARGVHRDAHRPAAACPNPGAAQRRHGGTGCRCGTCGFVDAIACPDRARQGRAGPPGAVIVANRRSPPGTPAVDTASGRRHRHGAGDLRATRHRDAVGSL